VSYSKIILQDSADIVWPLDDITPSASLSKAINFYSNGSYGNSASISIDNTDVVGTPIIFGGGSALRFISSSVGMSIPAIGQFSELYKNKNSCMSLWFQTDFLSGQEYPIWKKRNHDNVGLFIKDNYLIFRYGNSASYMEVRGDIERPEEPNHILVGKSPSSMILMINGIVFNSDDDFSIELDIDSNHTDNDYIDFYGPPSSNWIIDSVAMYSNLLTTFDARRHYVYGLGKSVGEDIFHGRGGTIYNFSSIDTEKIFKIDWRYPQEWRQAQVTDLNITQSGITPLNYDEPIFYSYNEDIQTSSNQISFITNSGSTVNAAYIDIRSLYQKIISGEYPFFVKVKFDGNLPIPFEKQTIISLGSETSEEILKFNLYNQSGSYKILIETVNSASAYFDVVGIENQPEAYIGMKFLDNSQFYFAQTGSFIQTASFNFYDEDLYGLDPLAPYFPLDYQKIIRIGSNISYDSSNYSPNLPSVNQFSGTFKSFSVLQNDFSASATYEDIDSYRQHRYKIYYDSDQHRFKTQTFGHLTFNLHSIDIGKFNNDIDQRLSANIVSTGYPDVSSSSQVLLYVTHYDYSGSVIYPRTRFYQNDNFPFINNNNLSGTFLKVDFEIYAEDVNYFPPKIKYFTFETYSGETDKVSLRHDDGNRYLLYNSASYVYLPEIKRTPSIFVTKNSGIKMLNSISEFTDDFSGKPLDPQSLGNLKIWLDSRFPEGLNVIKPPDDSYLKSWTDISGNSFNFIQNDSASAPIFRVQSKNVFANDQLNGGESGSAYLTYTVNSSVESDPNGAVSGRRGFKVTPDGNSVDSYIYMNNTASLSVYTNQEYSVVGTVKLSKPQTASYLHNLARTISVYVDEGTGLVFSASSSQAVNSEGEHQLFAQFTTSSSATYAEVRFYNGSYFTEDFVYWDNLGLYPSTASYLTSSWVFPLSTDIDMPSVKFNGGQLMESSASCSDPYTLYAVGRIFNSGNLIGNSSSGASIYSDGNYIYSKTSSAAILTSYDNDFHIYTIKVYSGSTSLYIDNNKVHENIVGGLSILDIILGDGSQGPLTGDISSIVLFEENHSDQTVLLVNSWLDQSFNLSKGIDFYYLP
jgi:hypothetical protein